MAGVEINLRQNQRTPLSVEQVDNNFSNLKTAVDHIGGLIDPSDLPLTQAQAAASSGASKIGIGAETVENALNALQLADYAALRAYTGPRKSVYVVASGLAGMFVRDDADTSAADNGGTVIVAGNGKRWKRSFSGPALVTWFGGDPLGANDSSPALELARAASKNVGFPAGTFKLTQAHAINASANDRSIIGGVGAGITIITYTGNDYPFKYNTDDSAGNVVRAAALRGMTIQGTVAALGAIRVRNSSELRFEDLYITGFTNPAAIIVDSNSVTDYAWGQRWRNVTIKYNQGSAIAIRQNKITDTVWDGVYISNNGNVGLQLGSGNGFRMIGGVIESCTYGIVLSTGINGAIGEPPLSAVVFLGTHLENNKFHVDINNAYAVGSERVYNATFDSLIIGGAIAPANDVPITVGFATDTVVRGTFINSPNANGLPSIDIKAGSAGTRVKATHYISTRPDVADAGIGSQIDRIKQAYSPAWTVASGTAPVLGNGVLSADYTQDGALVTANITLIGGSTTTYGSGAWRFSLPFKANPANRSIGHAFVHQNSTNKNYPGVVSVDAGTNVMQLAIGSNTFPTDFQNPFTWAAGDRMDISITYPILQV